MFQIVVIPHKTLGEVWMFELGVSIAIGHIFILF